MGIVTAGLSICAAALGGSYSSSHYIAVGISGIAYVSGNTTLGSEFFNSEGFPNRNQIDTNDLSSAKQVTFYANWAPNDISGCVLKEFGVFTAGSQLLNREVTTGSLVFTGEQELQIQQTILFRI